jgi:hypothetical protein
VSYKTLTIGRAAGWLGGRWWGECCLEIGVGKTSLRFFYGSAHVFHVSHIQRPKVLMFTHHTSLTTRELGPQSWDFPRAARGGGIYIWWCYGREFAPHSNASSTYSARHTIEKDVGRRALRISALEVGGGHRQS